MKRARFHAFAAFRIHQRTSTAATTTPATTSIQPSLPISTPGSCAVVNLHNLPPPASTFYRRSLPPILTSFNSSEGKKLFKESLAKGTAEAFLHLSGNLAHQSEPAFCGLGSLAIVLNALEIDPNRPWKGAWRWYDETLLDCCSPLETIKQKGITFDEFASLAKCNGLSLVAMRVLPDENEMGGGGGGSGNASTFKTLEASGTATSAATMVVSFSRKVLHQTGDGHFSPIGAFHEESGMVLVLDVARFKYPSYFVHVDVLYDAMKPLDKVTGKGRGYFLLS
ncbi:Phytochelatin synthase-domain-containing protein, partial [Obelidium mucronatum]